MSGTSENKGLIAEIREIRRNPIYSKPLSDRLIGLLSDSDHAISDLGGRGLEVLGEPAFEDLLAAVTAPGASPWPNAVWVLGSLSRPTDRLLPYLRKWLLDSTGRLEMQCALTLSVVLLDQKKLGNAVNPDDLAACVKVIERNSMAGGLCAKHQLTWFWEGWNAVEVSGETNQ